MTNPNRENPNGETQPVQPNPQSYGTGYNHGQSVERQRHEAQQQIRDESNTANGFLIGILLTGLVIGGSALAYFLTQRNQATPVQRTIVVPSASPSPSPSPEVRERVIERDRIVPVPQPAQPSPTAVPNVNINVPKPAEPPAPKVEPSPSPSPESTAPSPEPSPSVEPSPAPTSSPGSSQ